MHVLLPLCYPVGSSSSHYLKLNYLKQTEALWRNYCASLSLKCCCQITGSSMVNLSGHLILIASLKPFCLYSAKDITLFGCSSSGLHSYGTHSIGLYSSFIEIQFLWLYRILFVSLKAFAPQKDNSVFSKAVKTWFASCLQSIVVVN